MFRRKEEGGSDASPESAVQTSMPITGSTSVTQESASGNAVSGTSAQSSGSSYVTSPYAPSSQNSSARSASPAAASYRPAPMTDFSRPTNARAAEPARATSNGSAAVATVTGSAVPAFTAMADKSGHKTNRRVLTVGNDILLKGEIATCDRLVIEGRVEAKLSEVHTVEIAECGSFKGTAEVEDAEISGVFEGDLIVRNRLVIYSSGEVRGNITYGEIEIERGGRLTGQIKTVSTVAAQAPTAKTGLSAQEVKARVASKEFATV